VIDRNNWNLILMQKQLFWLAKWRDVFGANNNKLHIGHV